MSFCEVVITGLGVVSPLGIGREVVWDRLRAGQSGVRRIPWLADAGFPAPIGGVVEGFDPRAYVPNRKSLKVMARDAQLAVAAALLACRDAGIPGAVDPDRLGVILGADRISNTLETCEPTYRACYSAGRFDYRRWGAEGLAATFPLTFLMVLPNMAASHVSIALDARGPSNTVHHGDVSGLLALIEAARILQRGTADVMVAGGTSSQLTPFDWARHWAMGRLSRPQGEPATAMRPFDASRDGEVRGEGAAAVVLETAAHAEARRARILARVLAWSSAFFPPPSGRPADPGLARAVRQALHHARLQPGHIGFISAQGTATVEDDAREAHALAEALPGVAVTAFKSYLGNLGAAAGTVETVLAVLALENRCVPATRNFSQPDPHCPVAVSNTPRCLAHSAAVLVGRTSAGQSAAVILARPEA